MYICISENHSGCGHGRVDACRESISPLAVRGSSVCASRSRLFCSSAKYIDSANHVRRIRDVTFDVVHRPFRNARLEHMGCFTLRFP